MSFGGCDNLYEELWKACAGSMVHLPEAGDSAFYFPQGHLEQLEETTRENLDHILSSVNLPSKIHCRVVNVQLRAGEDDEVFAQITLLPEEIRSEHPESCRLQVPKPKFYSFSKVLVASDTDEHCRLHVLKQHADKCLPPLDMTQQTPSQVLSAKDLHGFEWPFKHVFGGQPGRHLFTTGWSNFVTSKRLVAGDSFVFLRGENGELRVGIRRVARPCISKPSPWVPSKRMVEVLATVSQAIATGSMFTVYYRPSFRKSQFIVGLNQFLEAVNPGYSVGMRFSMQLKGEDLIQRKYTGTIIGVDDIDPRWQNSARRLLKVRWDESTSITRPERVSPWDIEPLVESIPTGLVPPLESNNKDEMPRPQVAKRRKTEPELQKKCMEDLGTMIKELSQPTVPSSEIAGRRRADMPPVVASEACADFNSDAGVQELNNEGYNCEADPTTRDGSELMRSHPLGPRSASLTNDIAQPTFHGQSNQVLIDDLEGGGRVEGPNVSEIVDFPNFSPASDGNDSLMAYLLGFSEQFKCQSEASPLREQHLPRDPWMPLQRTSSTELIHSRQVMDISSTATQIPFSGPGNGNELINWGAYRVTPRCVPILDRIIARYPATLSSFRASSARFQSILLEILAEVVYMLEQHTVGNMDTERLDTARRDLADLKMSGIDMSWLEGRLNQIDRVWNKNKLVQRREELAKEVAEASAKVRRLEGELSSVEMELEEIAALSTDQSVIEGLL